MQTLNGIQSLLSEFNVSKVDDFTTAMYTQIKTLVYSMCAFLLMELVLAHEL